ncbi:MAG: glycosyltransferase family 39 protein [Patescibacteria group bacterium]
MDKVKFFKKIKKQLNRFTGYIKKNPAEFILLILLLAIASFLRFYKIGQYMTFLGDEGRDAIIVRRFLVDFDLMLIGPGTSVGNMYLGPLYYYMMAPALWLFNYSPLGPAFQIAVLGVITVLIVWLITKEWFGKKGAFIAALLYSISPTVIIYSRSSWNPNIMPFFSILSIYSIWRIWKKLDLKWLLGLGIFLAFALQSHYLGLLLFPIIGVFYLLTVIKLWPRKKNLDKTKEKIFYKRERKLFIKFSLIGLSTFLFLMSPLVIFDARHGWRNISSIEKFFTERQTTVSARPWTAIPKIPEITQEISSRLIGGKNIPIGGWVLVIVSVFSFVILVTKKKFKENEVSAYTILFIWIFFAIIGFGIYKQEVYDHYYGFFFTAPFVLVGGLFEDLLNRSKKFGKMFIWILVSILVYLNILENPFKYNPNNQLGRSEKVAQKIKEEYDNQPFNLAVIAERNYEDGYQYFLEKMKLPVTDIDAQRSDETIKDQLFVVCELPKEKCDPTHSPKAEVANFGWSNIEEEWELEGIVLFKLIHSQ